MESGALIVLGRVMDLQDDVGCVGRSRTCDVRELRRVFVPTSCCGQEHHELGVEFEPRACLRS